MKTISVKTLLITSLTVLFIGCDSGQTTKKETAGNQDQIPPPGDMSYTFYIQDINDSIASLYKSLGATSVESYVTWETCEQEGEGIWDWSRWDETVNVLKKNNLKWVPFLIVGPAYSTPGWFRAGRDHFPCRCLEHGMDSKIESLWNPDLPKWIDRFVKAFADRYKHFGVIESVLLGIQGDFGEAIYSVWGGGWTFDIPGEYHNHVGFWCDDPYALADFQDFIRRRYISLDKLNKAWGTAYTNFNKTDFPGRKEELEKFEKTVQSGDPLSRRRWIDFIDWYRGAMTNWADWWMGTARKYFPNTPIYLCTGGWAEPRHGSNFAEQTRVAAKHGAGIRITNEASDYKTNFSYTIWVASAAKHYHTYFGFEPAGEENENGIIARIYNATASGANQLFDYPSNITSSPGRTEVQQKHLKYLFHVSAPIVPVALWYPNVSLTLKWGDFLEKSALFRDYTDFDFIDETMLGTGALDQHKVLVIIQGKVMETADAIRIAEWIKNGGHAVVMDVPEFESVEATPEAEHILFGDAKSHKQMKGSITRVNSWDDLSGALRIIMSELGLPVCDLKRDSLFASQIGRERWLFLNTTSKSSVVKIGFLNGTHDVSINPGTITEVDLSKISK
ncbi:MAG: family 14 glycosylhydrolase [Mangrovibacterium sp.]